MKGLLSVNWVTGEGYCDECNDGSCREHNIPRWLLVFVIVVGLSLLVIHFGRGWNLL